MGRKKSREISIFNLSFLDVLSCGMGSVMLLSFVFAALPKEEPAKLESFVTGEIWLRSQVKNMDIPNSVKVSLFLEHSSVPLGIACEQKNGRCEYKDTSSQGVYVWPGKDEHSLKFMIRGKKSTQWNGRFEFDPDGVHLLLFRICLTTNNKQWTQSNGCMKRYASHKGDMELSIPFSFKGEQKWFKRGN